MMRRRHLPVPKPDPSAIDGALSALSEDQLRELVRDILPWLDDPAHARVVNRLIDRAARGESGWAPPRPSKRDVSGIVSFAEAARRIGSADPSDVDGYLRQGSSAFLGKDYAAAYSIFRALLLPIGDCEIDLGQHELVDEVLGVEVADCAAQYVVSMYMTAVPDRRAEAVRKALSEVRGIGHLWEPLREMKQKKKQKKKRRMPVGKQPSSAWKKRTKRVLDRMSTGELATILRALLENHPNLGSEVHGMAVDMLSVASIDDTADDLFETVTSLGIEDFGDRAGPQPWGYVEPSEAAWELLGEAVEPVIHDMKRRAELGLETAAVGICSAIVLGLYRIGGHDSDGLLAYAPDFASEEACFAIEELIRATPSGKRNAVRSHLLASLPERVPDWASMITRAARRKAKRK